MRIYYPHGLPLLESLPPAADVLDPTRKIRFPSQGKLAAVDNIWRWHQHHDAMQLRDSNTSNSPQLGDSAIPRREQSRFISVSQPYAGAWHAVPGNGTSATTLETKLWAPSMQRDLGLHLSRLKPTLVALAAAGETVDFFGNDAINKSNHNRRAGAGLRGWYDAIAAVATTPTVLGDKENSVKTKQFNDFNNTHVVDIVEIGAGENGEDVCNELKCYAFARSKDTKGKGQGGRLGGKTTPANGHKIGFGNTEEDLRIENLGNRKRGRPCDGVFSAKTGKGWVPARSGCYSDALVTKRNRVEILVHENLGGGFSPPAAAKMRRQGRSAREGTDRTMYKNHRPISYVSYHTRAISMGTVRAEAWTMFHAVARAKSKLYRIQEKGGGAFQGGA